MRRKLQRIAITNITGQVQFKGQNVIFGNTFTEKVTLKQIAKQIGLAASANTGDHFHLTIPHKGDDFLQIAISFYFHSPTSIENLLELSCYFSMNIILRREEKINSLAEKFTNKPDNISMKQARRYTTIQLDIIHTGDCIKVLKNHCARCYEHIFFCSPSPRFFSIYQRNPRFYFKNGGSFWRLVGVV